MSTPPTVPRPSLPSVMTRLLSGRSLVYELGANSSMILRSAGPWRIFATLSAITVATIMSYDRQFNEMRQPRVLALGEKPTALNKTEDNLIVKADRPAWQSLGLGFFSSATKPMIVAQKVMRTASGQDVPCSELLATMFAYGLVPMIVNGCQVIASPDMYAKAAETAAIQAVDNAKQRMWNLPWQVITCQIPITKVMSEYTKLRNATEEATRQAATLQTDGVGVFNAAFRYYTTSKLFEFAGGAGAGALTAFTYNRYLASPAERLFGPAFRGMTRVATLPMRPVFPAAAARELGTLIARRSPLAILMLLQGLGTYYHTQNEFQNFINDMARSYPEVASQVVAKIKST
jgi:hypothetical protein